MDFAVKDLLEYFEKRQAVATIDVEGAAVAVVPGVDGATLQSLERFRDEQRGAPKRIAGVGVAGTLDAFVALVNRHKDSGSAVFGDFGASPSLTAVVDYHTLEHEPRFGRHRIAYGFPLSEEWTAWRAANGKAMTQAEWAAFIEDRIADLASPYDAEAAQFGGLFQTKVATPAELITLARGLSVSVEAKVIDARVLQSGEAQLVYEETHRDAAGAKLIVPGLFIVNAPLFVGAAPSRVLARLRYRAKEGRVTWFYQLYRADDVVREALRAALNRVAAETELPTFEATPEK